MRPYRTQWGWTLDRASVQRATRKLCAMNRGANCRDEQIPRVERTNPKGGMNKSQGWDEQIPREGRTNPKGGTKRSQGRDETIPREGRKSPKRGGTKTSHQFGTALPGKMRLLGRASPDMRLLQKSTVSTYSRGGATPRWGDTASLYLFRVASLGD